MMISFITPTRYVEKYSSQSNFILALSHLIDLGSENQYEKAIKKTKLPIYLDNGLFENHFPESIESLIEKALKINASLFFAPDYLYDCKKTEQSIDKTWKIMEKMKVVHKLKLGAVIQADNSEDYIQSYKKFTDDNRVNLIGLSILSIPNSFSDCTQTRDITKNRSECLNQLNSLQKHKNSHLLGAGDSYADINLANSMDWVVSHDSSSAFWNGLHGKKISEKTLKIEGGKSKIAVDFNYFKMLTKKQEDDIQFNINVIKNICK